MDGGVCLNLTKPLDQIITWRDLGFRLLTIGITQPFLRFLNGHKLHF